MLLHVLHRTTFVYAGPARDSFNEVRLRPVDDDRQRCTRFNLGIKPLTGEVRDYFDYYGNRVHYFDLPDQHRRLTIEAESDVETVPESRRPPIPVVPTAPAPSHFAGDRAPGLELYAEYLTESHYVPLAVELWREMQDVFAIVPRTDIWTDTRHLGRHIYSTFSYKPKTTGVGTLATDVLAQRVGVCQDYAHVLLGLCRIAGIPARYVSGYFFNDSREPGTPEASHAWVEVLLPGFGWVGYDPTHDRPADERYIKIAAGRDYADIRPVSGTYRGAPTRELRVEVAVRAADASASK
ncbi:MAG TPA: transglutaminase family protein [Opitutus sp.]|nr:transglutaminase family protein [Opitutus sp.]